jgi:hypothetical protein
VTSRSPELAELEALGEAGWRWVLDQVQWADGPTIPGAIAGDGTPLPAEGNATGLHSGIGGLAQVLAEIRLARAWTHEEQELAAGIVERLRRGIPSATDPSFFDGLVSDIGVLTTLQAEGAEAAVARLSEIAEPDGWPQDFLRPPRYLPNARVSDASLGTGAVLLGTVWAHRAGIAGSRELAERAAEVLLGEAEVRPTGLDWRFVPLRFRSSPPIDMPNWSHGLAGIACTLVLAGMELSRPDLVEAGRLGAEHLVTLGDTRDGRFAVPHFIPHPPDLDEDEFAFGWCNGAAGTSRLFPALGRAGVETVAGQATEVWERRSLRTVLTSGVPERLHPGFWDNDGRCCGTAGVGDVFLDVWQRGGDDADLTFALRLAYTLLDRAYRDGRRAWWRFVEHRNPEPLLPPGVGWMQGSAGIAAYLFRAARLARDGRGAPVVARMDNWWALPEA